MRILIVAPAWVGDMVMAHTLVATLHRQHADAHVHMLAPAATLPLAERMPGVAGATLLDAGHGELGLAARRTVARTLQDFAQAYVLPNSFKSALVPFFAGIPRRVGWTGEARIGLLNDRRRLDEARYPLMIERFMALAHAPGADLPEPYPRPVLTVNEANRVALLEKLELESAAPLLALCPGAEFGPAKRWPERHYAEVARHALADGQSVWLMGSPGDQEACADIATLAPGCVNLAGRTSLLDAIDLLSLADTVVCNDSGLMHVACALDRRVIALYGSTSPGFTPPLGEQVQVLRLGIDCSPCFERVCPLGHMRCLNDLEPRQVIELLP